MKPDEVLEKYRNKNIKIKIWYEDGNEDSEKTVFFEGSKESLKFMGEVFIAASEDSQDCGFQLDKILGEGFFKDENSATIYIHRLPCMDK